MRASRPPPFDMAFVEGYCTTADEGRFTQEISACAERLQASHKERAAAQALSVKIKQKLDLFVANPSLLEALKIEDVYEVGSVKTETALLSHCIADIVVITSSLPTFEAVSRLATKIMENFGTDEYVSCVSRDYGCSVIGQEAQARILVTITPDNAPQLEPDLHLSVETMRIAYQSIRHTHWVEAVSAHGPLKELIRVVKDVRRRFKGLEALNIWTIQYLCWWCMMKLPERTPLSLGPAFRRVFQLLAAGLFLPDSPVLTDPTEPTQGIGSELNYEQMDTVCSTAQSILRLICNKGQSMVLGVTRIGSDFTKENTFFNGVMIKPNESIYSEDDMKPKFCEEDLRLLSVQE